LRSPGAARAGAAHVHVENGAAHLEHPAAQVIALAARENVVSPLAEYDVEGSGSSGSEDSDAPFAPADAAAALAASGCSPSTDAVPSGDGGLADEEEGLEDAEDDDVDDEDEDQGDVGGSYSDVDGDSDPEDSAIRCMVIFRFVSPHSPHVQR
jgi:hypothetical protein